jgi:hypothetical protein
MDWRHRAVALVGGLACLAVVWLRPQDWVVRLVFSAGGAGLLVGGTSAQWQRRKPIDAEPVPRPDA